MRKSIKTVPPIMNGLKRLRAESCERLNAKPEQFPFIRNADQLGVHVSLTRLSTHAFLSRSATPANDMPAAIALTRVTRQTVRGATSVAIECLRIDFVHDMIKNTKATRAGGGLTRNR